jgi:pimeloyl-ACP methyl ester carboxylesterase
VGDNPAVLGIEQWWADGERLALRFGGAEWEIFVQRLGAGPRMTLLHGFPSSSHDWAKVAPSVAQHYELSMPDFLGFGASEKPADHEYSLDEQADLVEALWEHDGITRTTVVAHDYGVSVGQELLARRAEGKLAVELERIYLLNGGLYPDLHRPQPIQTALLDSERGPKIGPSLTGELLANGLAPTFARGFDGAADSAEIWRGLTHDGGQLILHRLIRYMPDRVANAQRWVSALEATDVPLAFIWGMLDPISGAHIAQRIRERLPDAPLLALEDVAHWPPLEAPDTVAVALSGG